MDIDTFSRLVPEGSSSPTNKMMPEQITTMMIRRRKMSVFSFTSLLRYKLNVRKCNCGHFLLSAEYDAHLEWASAGLLSGGLKSASSSCAVVVASKLPASWASPCHSQGTPSPLAAVRPATGRALATLCPGLQEGGSHRNFDEISTSFRLSMKMPRFSISYGGPNPRCRGRLFCKKIDGGHHTLA